MASKARKAFDENAADIVRLLEIHGDLGGDAPGRRYRLEVLNKSAVVLITSFWEAYCDDLAAEALEHIVTHAKSAASLSKEIKKTIAKEISADQNQIAAWDLSDNGWRKVLRSRLVRLQQERSRRLNTPKSANIDDLFLSALGIAGISQFWAWHRMTADHARKKLDKYVALRGEIAHRGHASHTCKKPQVEDYFRFIKRVVAKTGGHVNSYVKVLTGVPLW